MCLQWRLRRVHKTATFATFDSLDTLVSPRSLDTLDTLDSPRFLDKRVPNGSRTGAKWVTNGCQVDAKWCKWTPSGANGRQMQPNTAKCSLYRSLLHSSVYPLYSTLGTLRRLPALCSRCTCYPRCVRTVNGDKDSALGSGQRGHCRGEGRSGTG